MAESARYVTVRNGRHSAHPIPSAVMSMTVARNRSESYGAKCCHELRDGVGLRGQGRRRDR